MCHENGYQQFSSMHEVEKRRIFESQENGEKGFLGRCLIRFLLSFCVKMCFLNGSGRGG